MLVASSGRLSRLCSYALALFLFLVLGPRGEAQIHVNTTTQGDTHLLAGGPYCSLQEAIYATQFGQAIALDQTDPDDTYNSGCVDYTGLWYQIMLQPGATYKFDHFWDGDGHNPFGPTAAPIICNVVSIVGNGATLQWTGTGYSRMFAVGYASYSPTSGVVKSGSYCGVVTPDLDLHDVYIKGFSVKGGDGVGGGGGGLGAGGAIYIGRLPGKDQPTLTVQTSNFVGNTE